MSELKLTVTDRAMECMLAMGKEFMIASMHLNMHSGSTPAAVCCFGAPKANARAGYVHLTQGELTVWVPLEDSFINDEVIIDLYGVASMVLPIALTAILTPTCGSCAHCATSCSLRHENDKEL